MLLFSFEYTFFYSNTWFEFCFMAVITVFLKTLPPLTVGKGPFSGKFVALFFFLFVLKESCSLLSIVFWK